MITLEERLQALEEKLLTPENFSVREYLNFGRFSVVNESDRLLILEEFEKLSTAEQQMNLSILWAIQPYRTHLGFPIFITCGKRTHAHELRKNRNGTSTHLWGAVDFTCRTEDELRAYSDLLSTTWIGGFKYYANNRFIHVDISNNRRW